MNSSRPTRSARATPVGPGAPRRDAPATPNQSASLGPPTKPPVVHRWTITGEVPPAAWAALLVDMRAVLAAAKSRNITLAGPDGTGAPILDGDRIALAVQFGDRPWSDPFVMTRAAGPGEVRSPLGDSYDALVLTALNRAGRHLGALITSSSEASPKALAMAGRTDEVLFGSADRAVAGQPAPNPRTQLEQLVASTLDDAETALNGPAPAEVYLQRLIPALQAELDGRTDTTSPA